MRFFRPQRMNSLIRDELSKLIMRELEFTGALVTITDVEVNEEMEHAVVNVSVLPSEKSEKVLEILNNHKKDLQFKLHRKLNIRPIPEIAFKIDFGLKNAATIEKALLDSEK